MENGIDKWRNSIYTLVIKVIYHQILDKRRRE